MKKLEFNPVNLVAGHRRVTVARVCLKAAGFIVVSFFVAVLYYLVFALLHDTETERTLKEENRRLASEYDAMTSRTELVDNVIEGIILRDEAIYKDVFNASLPNYVVNAVTLSDLDFHRMVRQDESVLVEKANRMVSSADSTAAIVSSILDSLLAASVSPERSITSIPSLVPVRNFSVGQTGASVGERYDPFFKTIRRHTGIDIMVPAGTEVIAPSDGVVLSVKTNDRSSGKVISIDHGGGIVTVYKHLGNVYVDRGRIVKRGRCIATVGTSGRSFAPHLHYEVIKDGGYMEPVHYFFADLDAVSYQKTLLLASTTGQSMD